MKEYSLKGLFRGASPKIRPVSEGALEKAEKRPPFPAGARAAFPKLKFWESFWILILFTGCLFPLGAVELAQQIAKGSQARSSESGTVLRSMEDRGPYKIVERSDWSRYDNGRYVGHVYREVRASILPGPNQGAGLPGARWYRGNFFVLEETLRDMRQSARAVDAVVPVSFEITGQGEISVEDDRGFPSLRGFPVFPHEPVNAGVKWTAPGRRAVDPLNEGHPVVVPLTAEYEYRGVESYRDTPVHRIFARYASRHQQPGPGFNQLQGTHEVDILIRVSDGMLLLMRDTLDETYTWADGTTVQFRGFTLTFGEGIIPLDRGALALSIGKALKSPPAPGPSGGRGTDPAMDAAGIDVAEVDEGLRLTLRDARFYPDSDEFLPGERSRLDLIARALGQISGRTFLVEGHTAAVGNPSGEMELSLKRAGRMVDELVRRGIPPERFIYKGWGGTKPLGDNGNEAGRAQNRRVEITILE
ncbi:MAG: OmpA family protein [Spirochaetaceae bacterium]|jgi:outer membrane protein OmpA-like peptidoglycan-associated protein|nr:OmpA family protein [Spirochaetaceae bacterium]